MHGLHVSKHLFAYFLFAAAVWLARLFSACARVKDGYWGRRAKNPNIACWKTTTTKSDQTDAVKDEAMEVTGTAIKEYAGGWITERKGTESRLPQARLHRDRRRRCIAYIFIYMNGEIDACRARRAGAAR